MKIKSRKRGDHCWSCGKKGMVLSTEGDLSIIDAGQVKMALGRAMRTGRMRSGQVIEAPILICCGGAWMGKK